MAVALQPPALHVQGFLSEDNTKETSIFHGLLLLASNCVSIVMQQFRISNLRANCQPLNKSRLG